MRGESKAARALTGVSPSCPRSSITSPCAAIRGRPRALSSAWRSRSGRSNRPPGEPITTLSNSRFLSRVAERGGKPKRWGPTAFRLCSAGSNGIPGPPARLVAAHPGEPRRGADARGGFQSDGFPPSRVLNSSARASGRRLGRSRSLSLVFAARRQGAEKVCDIASRLLPENLEDGLPAASQYGSAAAGVRPAFVPPCAENPT